MGNGGGVGLKCTIPRVFIKEIQWNSDEGLRRGARIGEIIGAERIKNRISQEMGGGGAGDHMGSRRRKSKGGGVKCRTSKGKWGERP